MSDQTDDGIHKSVSRLLLGHAQKEYEDLCNTWRDLERKAQGNIAIAGIFLAGTTLALRVLESPTTVQKTTIMISLLLLSLSIIQSIRVLFTKEVSAMEDSTEVRVAAEDIFNTYSDQEAKEKIRRFVLKRLVQWEFVNQDVHRVNGIKANILSSAQRLLMASILVVVFLLVLATYYK